MTTDDLNLPYEYADNPRAGTITIVALTVLASIVMALITLFARFSISWFIVAAPVVLLLARMWLYSLIRNAVHEATRLADADYKLDDMVEDRLAEMRRTGLTPGFLNEKLIGTAE